MARPFALLTAFVTGVVVYILIVVLNQPEIVTLEDQGPSLITRLFWSLAAAGGAYFLAWLLTRTSKNFRSRRSDRLQLLMAADGLTRLRRGEIDEAERALRECVARDPENVPALQGLAEIAVRRGDAEPYIQLANRLLALPADTLLPAERVALCHRQADLCLSRLNNPVRAAEALARVELDYPNTSDALRARQRIESILNAPSPGPREAGPTH